MRTHMNWRRSAAVATMTLALMAIAAGVTFAASSSKQITVCFRHKGGALYKAKSCAKHDSKLTWNATGPQGSAGMNGSNGTNGTNGTGGSNGINGTNGTNGTVTGYYTQWNTGDPTISLPNDTVETVTSMQLPAGNYIATATAGIHAETTTQTPPLTAGADCYIQAASTSSPGSQWASPLGQTSVSGTYLANGTVTATTSLELTTTTTVDLKCYSTEWDGTFTVDASNWSMNAVQTSSNTDSGSA
jgi:hypothetical protein